MANSTVQNTILADELEAINAIYGDGTISLTSTDAVRTLTELRLPDDLFTYLVSFPSLYPDSALLILGIDSLDRSRDPLAAEHTLYLRIALLLSYRKGEVVLFDAVEEYVRILARSRGTSGDADLANSKAAPTQYFQSQPEELASRALIALDQAKSTPAFSTEQLDLLSSQIVSCSVCLEATLAPFSVKLPACKHSYCISCFQEGFSNMMAGNGEFRCCGGLVPVHLVQQYANLGTEDLNSYRIFMTEATSMNPLYCSEKSCSAFIASYLIRDSLAKCLSCKTITCVTCRRKQHQGICGYELKQITRLARTFRWQSCPNCAHMVSRTLGCNHMVCICGTRFCYQCGQKQDFCGCR
jgi:E3 ubiquitin-protein ligase RNF144